MGSGWASTLQGELGYPVTAGENYYKPGCTSSSQCVFPNAVIPQSAFTVPTQNLMKYIPLPNAGAFFTTSAYEETLSDNKGSGRLDANTSLGMISGYYFIDNYVQLNPYAVSSLPGFAASNNGEAEQFNFGITKSHGPSSVNELRLDIHAQCRVSKCARRRAGSFTCLPGLYGHRSGWHLISRAFKPSVSTTTAIGASSSFLQLYDNSYQVLDNFSKVVGTHTLKIGGIFNYDQVTYKFHFALNGNFSI